MWRRREWLSFFGGRTPELKKQQERKSPLEIKQAIIQSITDKNLSQLRAHLLEYAGCGNVVHRDLFSILNSCACDLTVVERHPNPGDYNKFFWLTLVEKIPEDGFARYANEFNARLADAAMTKAVNPARPEIIQKVEISEAPRTAAPAA